MLSEDTRRASAKRLGNLLFVPALTIPAVTVIVTLAAPRLVFGGTSIRKTPRSWVSVSAA